MDSQLWSDCEFQDETRIGLLLVFCKAVSLSLLRSHCLVFCITKLTIKQDHCWASLTKHCFPLESGQLFVANGFATNSLARDREKERENLLQSLMIQQHSSKS